MNYYSKKNGAILPKLRETSILPAVNTRNSSVVEPIVVAESESTMSDATTDATM